MINNKKLTLPGFSRGMVTTSALVAAMTLSTAATANTLSVLGKGADISSMCGTKPMTVGLADGFGGNTWRRIAWEELKDELSHCSNVTKVMYTNANGDRQKGNADINSLVAQGVDILIVFPDFGAAQLPALRKATKAGVVVVPYNARLDGKSGKDYTANLYLDSASISAAWADWYGENLKSGKLIFIGGSAGNAISQNLLDGFKAGLQKYPDLKLLEDNFIAGNWNPVDAQKAVSGLIAKYPDIDGIVTDYGVTAYAVIKAYDQAGLPVPALSTLSSNNQLNCAYMDRQETADSFPYFSLDGTTTLVRFAIRRGVAAYQGTENDETEGVMAFLNADSTTGLEPKCDKQAPVDADLSSILAYEKLQEIFNK
ncbi:substrate-binding domain-containing protein [Marinobacterium sp. YM272]|uniref:substrate-binding domain-containing protein n=1 Tax=Marinobacterium sp. YM272 TaxID=3421654 RepID=UPI003D7FB090